MARSAFVQAALHSHFTSCSSISNSAFCSRQGKQCVAIPAAFVRRFRHVGMSMSAIHTAADVAEIHSRILPLFTSSFYHLSEVTNVNYNSLAVTALVFILTFWGGISFVKGSTKPRITQASFSIPTQPPAVAKTVTKYLTTRGFKPDPDVDARPGVVTFEGKVRSSTSVAIILVLVGASGLWAASLMLNLILPDNLKSESWGWLALLSLLIVPWYRKNAERNEQVKVMVEEDGPEKSILYVKGHRDELLSMESALGWTRNDPDKVEKLAGTSNAEPAS